MKPPLGELFLLVTDQGFLMEPNVVWETLSNVEGDCHFVDANFRTYSRTDIPIDLSVSPGSDVQIDHDYQLALSLQQESSPDPVATNQTMPMATSCPSISHTSVQQNLYKQQQTQSDHSLALKLQAESTQEAQAILQNRNQGQRSRVPQSTAESAKTKSNSSCCIL